MRGKNDRTAKSEANTENRGMQRMENDHFSTSDLATAAILLASDGIVFTGLEGSDPRRLEFQFKPTKQAERIALDFLAGSKLVNARLYWDCLRRAKDILFSAERQRVSRVEQPAAQVPAKKAATKSR